MATKNIVSSPGHLNTLGGETQNRIFEGLVVGIVLGFFAGCLLTVLAVKRVMGVPGLEQMTPLSSFFFFTFLSCVCLGAAGAVVGIGIPKFKTRPDQGPIKRWRSVVVKKGEHREVFFVPEERRRTVNSPVNGVNWKKREPMGEEKGYPHSHSFHH